MKKRKTLQDVARAAGVSKMTASRALRDGKDVSPASLQKVQDAARELGYFRNHLAASLGSKRSDLIGVVVPSLTNIVFPEVMTGITEVLEGTGLQPVFGVTDYDEAKEQGILRNMLSWRPAGLIVTGLDQPQDTRKLLAEADVPIVQIMDTDGDPIDACVGFSQTEAGYEMGRTLADAGCRGLAYVGCNTRMDTRSAKRKVGFRKLLAERGLKLHADVAIDAVSSVAFGREITAELIASHPGLDAIYFSNDDLAMGALCYCLEAGISVPQDMVLAGFNGLDLLAAMPGKITTSHTARQDIGAAAARMIVQSMEGEDDTAAKTHVIKPTIVMGDLAKRSPKHADAPKHLEKTKI